MKYRFADRMDGLFGSAVRNPLFEDPELISLAPGKPEGSVFPAEELIPIATDVLLKYREVALQYSDTEGLYELRDLIAKQRMAAAGVDCTAEDITLTSGSQEAIEMAAKIFINEGDTIIVEDPSYVGVYNAWKPYNPKYVGIPMDEDGMRMDALEEVLKTTPNAKMIYTIPDFQNPTGIVMSDDRRKKLAELAAEYQIPVIEDGPYSDLYYYGERHPSIKSFDKDGWVVNFGSFSKIFCPGFRLAWVCADPVILEKFQLCKQGSNLQCSTFDEMLALEYMKKHDINEHIEHVRAMYKERRDTMVECIEKYFPADVKHTSPMGGFFLWLELPEGIDTGEMLTEACLKYKVGYVQGEGFFCEPGRKNFIRLSYSYASPEKIEEGMKRLGNLLTKYYK